MSKGKRAQYTLEFKIEAVRLVRSGQSVAAVSATLGVSDQTLHNWVKADSRGLLKGTAARPVSPEQMEISRLRALSGAPSGAEDAEGGDYSVFPLPASRTFGLG